MILTKRQKQQQQQQNKTTVKKAAKLRSLKNMVQDMLNLLNA